MKLFDRAVAVPYRKTRFHDEKGNRIGIGGAIYAPAALISAALRVAFGYRPARPLISYRAAKHLDGLLRKDWRGVEFGSGYSTPWLARRLGFLLSIEDDPDWHRRVGSLLADTDAAVVRHELRTAATYADLADFPDGFFDFALVDGSRRAACIAAVAPKIRPGGWLYLDNSDKDMTKPDGDLRRAEALLLDLVRQRGGETRYFTDFAPTNFFVEQGLLTRL